MLSARMLMKEDGGEAQIGQERLKATPLGRVAIRHMLRPATILSLQRFLSEEPAFTHLDLLVAAACTDDCEPVLRVNFEELELLAEELARCRSQLLQRAHGKWRRLLQKGGKRFLAALKTGALLLAWTQSGDIEAVAAQYNCYAFDVLRVCESMDRLLLAAAAIEELVKLAATGPLEEGEGDQAPSKSDINLLRHMVLNGVDQQVAGLTLISGIGAKWARKFINAGITDLSALATSSPSRLLELGGLSEKRAQTWIAAAQELLETQVRRDCSPLAPFVRTKREPLDLTVDPYRLRRALELSVRPEGPRLWTVSGGLESHCLSDGAGGDRPELRCDCLDYAKGEQACKHVLAVRLYCNDSELRATAERMGRSSAEHFDLFSFWFDGSL
jgi:helicase